MRRILEKILWLLIVVTLIVYGIVKIDERVSRHESTWANREHPIFQRLSR